MAYEKKINMVKGLSDAIVPVQGNVKEIRYEIWNDTKFNYDTEFLVIEYVGGAKSVRNCTGNSCSAIVSEIASKLNSGYYDEISWYENDFVNNPNAERIA